MRVKTLTEQKEREVDDDEEGRGEEEIDVEEGEKRLRRGEERADEMKENNTEKMKDEDKKAAKKTYGK